MINKKSSRSSFILVLFLYEEKTLKLKKQTPNKTTRLIIIIQEEFLMHNFFLSDFIDYVFLANSLWKKE